MDHWNFRRQLLLTIGIRCQASTFLSENIWVPFYTPSVLFYLFLIWGVLKKSQICISRSKMTITANVFKTIIQDFLYTYGRCGFSTEILNPQMELIKKLTCLVRMVFMVHLVWFSWYYAKYAFQGCQPYEQYKVDQGCNKKMFFLQN